MIGRGVISIGVYYRIEKYTLSCFNVCDYFYFDIFIHASRVLACSSVLILVN